MNLPFTDEYMRYDTFSHRYILTEKYITERFGTGFKSKNKNTLSLVLDRVSALVYGFIHEHNDSAMQDYIIAKTFGGRNVILEAMSNQFAYMVLNGDLTASVDENKRSKYLDISAVQTLLKTIPEIGTNILYTGSLYYCSHDKTPW